MGLQRWGRAAVYCQLVGPEEDVTVLDLINLLGKCRRNNFRPRGDVNFT